MSRCRQLLIVLFLSAPGCDRSTVAPARQPAAEPTWSEQLADVRAGRSRRIVVARQSVTASQFGELADGCSDLDVLDLESVAIGSDDLAVLAQLPHLQRIKLGGPVDDVGIGHLVKATGLTAVNLPSATFTDRGLELLSRLPKLELLRFRSPNVTDDGLKHVAAMPALRFLHLIDVPVTDAGIAHVHSMSNLESFYLDGGACTDVGLRALLKALPELHFHRDQLHLSGDPRADDHGDVP
jgi:hypothetical protein